MARRYRWMGRGPHSRHVTAGFAARRRQISGALGCCVLAVGAVSPVGAVESTCYGTSSRGRLEHGASLPLGGSNFLAYSTLGWSLGRAYLHSRVRSAVLDAFALMQEDMPDRVFVYGETGWQNGGPFKPHRTHQNGLSVDIMVPVQRAGASWPLPGDAFNRFGYGMEFDAQGRSGDIRIDFEALGQLLFRLSETAERQGAPIARVIFDPALHAELFATSRGNWLRRSITFMQHQAWVRHDEHIHIDFSLTCAPLHAYATSN